MSHKKAIKRILRSDRMVADVSRALKVFEALMISSSSSTSIEGETLGSLGAELGRLKRKLDRVNHELDKAYRALEANKQLPQ